MKPPTSVQTKLDLHDVKADWPPKGRALPFATFTQQATSTQPTSQATSGNQQQKSTSREVRDEHFWASSPFAVRQPANMFSDSEDETSITPDIPAKQESPENDVDEGNDHEVERDLAYSCQALEDGGMALFTNGC
jgi:hypothetical protein